MDKDDDDDEDDEAAYIINQPTCKQLIYVTILLL